MEALGNPSISPGPMGGGHAFRIPKTSVCRWQVQRQYTFVRSPEIHFNASGFFVKIFDCLFVFVFVCFWSSFSFFFFFFFFFFASKTTLKITVYEPVELHIIVYFSRLSRDKSIKSVCYLKSISRCILCTKQSCIVCK